ncbi:MAG: tyrosine-type recombinase/integrase [Kiritimatiellae bacterium]|nr:tyrosine-type recombinase/integrase [Kiritimatiellia bacterium]
MGKVLRSVPPECIKTLLSSLECGPAPALRDKAIVCLLEGYGVRSVQVRNLRFEDINWPEKTIHFRAAKGGRPVDQFLTTRVGNALAAYISRERPKSSHKEVFLTSREPFVPFSRSDQISWILTKRFRKARITLPEGVSYGSHGFRHTFASSLYGKAPFKDIVVELIKHYLSIRELENIEFDHLFLNKNKKPITRFGIGRVVEKYVKKRQPSANH